MIRHDPLVPGFVDEALPLLALLGARSYGMRLREALGVTASALPSPPRAPLDHPAHLVVLGLLTLMDGLEALIPSPGDAPPPAELPTLGDLLR